jgi:hypothetical protein
MASKKSVKPVARKKLAVRKQTLKDLSPRGGAAKGVKGGKRRVTDT